jgi:ABC-type phosphate transport system permease subunit
MPLGFFFIAAGIAAIIYPVYNRPREEWLMWGAASILTFIIGLIFLGSAFVHKVKSDLIRRGRPMYKVVEEKEEEEED